MYVSLYVYNYILPNYLQMDRRTGENRYTHDYSAGTVQRHNTGGYVQGYGRQDRDQDRDQEGQPIPTLYSAAGNL